MLWWIAQNALLSGLLAAAAAVICRMGRFSPAVKHALWLLVLVKLITPPIGWYRVPVSFDFRPPWLAGERGPPRPTAEALSFVEASSDVALPAGSVALSGDTEMEIFPEGAGMPRALPRTWRSGWWIVLAWLAGAIPFAAIQITRLLRFSRLLRGATQAPKWLGQLVHRTASHLNLRPPEIAVVPVLCSPMVCALGRPRLLWPAALEDRLTHEARAAVVLHELAHLRRRDHWVAWLELLAGVVWWFNPVYWLVRHQLRENAELACDAWVVGLLPTGRRAYAQALLEVTEFVSSAPASLPAVAMGHVARTSLEKRLTMILRERIPYRVPLVGAGAIGLALLAVLPGWSRGQAPAAASANAHDDPHGSKGQHGIAAAIPAGDEVPSGSSALAEDTTSLDNAVLGIEVLSRIEPTPGGQAAGTQDRISELESKLEQLLGEVKALRSHSAPAGMAHSQLSAPAGMRTTKTSPTWHKIRMARRVPSEPQESGGRVETLTRARYELPEGKAQPVSEFIRQFVTADVEAKAEGETLTVIASQLDQAKIAAFIDLIASGHGTARIHVLD